MAKFKNDLIKFSIFLKLRVWVIYNSRTYKTEQNKSENDVQLKFNKGVALDTYQ